MFDNLTMGDVESSGVLLANRPSESVPRMRLSGRANTERTVFLSTDGGARAAARERVSAKACEREMRAEEALWGER